MRVTASAKKFLSGLLGAAVLLPVLYFSYTVGRGIYCDYVLFPRLKAEEHYIRPTRWQDLVFLTVFWAVALILFWVGFRLIRYAMKRRFQADATPGPG